MEFIKKLGSYSLGNVIILLAGIISFPMFTRMLSPADYGLMSLINLTVALCITFCKGGLQQALIREWDADECQNHVVLSTALWGSMMISSGIFIVLGIVAALLAYVYDSSTYLIIFLLATGLAVTETIKSIIYNKIRATQQALKYNTLTITSKYCQIAFAIVFMYCFGRTSFSLLTGFIIASVLIVSWMLYKEKELIGLSSFEFPRFKSMLSFGVPLIFYELTSQVLTFVDRYFIGFYKGSEAVGKYSAAYNLTYYIQSLLVASVSLTITPMIVEKLNKDGYAASKVFIQESLLWFCLIGSAITLGFAAVGSDIFILTASIKYAEAAVIIAPVICGGFLFGIFTVAAGDLFVRKSSNEMAVIMGIAAIMNVALNMILIPFMGLMGAAYATLIPETFLAAVGLWKMGAFSEPRQMMLLLYYAVPSVIMYASLLLMNGRTTWPSVCTRTLAGLLIWSFSVLLLNSKIRKYVCASLVRTKPAISGDMA